MTGWYLCGPFTVHTSFFPALEQIRSRSAWEGSCWHACLWAQQTTFVWTASSAHGPGFSISEKAPAWWNFDIEDNSFSCVFSTYHPFTLSSVIFLSCLSVSRGCTLRTLPKHGQWPFLVFLIQSSGFSFTTPFGKHWKLYLCMHRPLLLSEGVRVLFNNNGPAQVVPESELGCHGQTHPYVRTLKGRGGGGSAYPTEQRPLGDVAFLFWWMLPCWRHPISQVGMITPASAVRMLHFAV